MSFSKTLTATVAAVTVAGAVGFAYAQSTPDSSTAPAPASCRHEPAGKQHGAAGRHQHDALELGHDVLGHDVDRHLGCPVHGSRAEGRPQLSSQVDRGHRRPFSGPRWPLSRQP